MIGNNSLPEKCSDDFSFRSGEAHKHQKKLWNDLFSKFSSSEVSSDEGLFDTTHTFSKKKATVMKQINVESQSLQTEMDVSKQRFDLNVMSEKDVLRVVKNFIEEELKSKLKYYYIKGISSRIKRDKKEFYWTSLVKMEIKNIKRKLNIEYIKLYLTHLIPSCSKTALCDLIEKKYKSKLKYYLKLLKSDPSMQDSSKKYIEREWTKLRKNVSEKYICLYCIILNGPISLLD